MPDTNLAPYRGSTKHKNRPARGRKGTLCPEWTHSTPDGGLGNNVHAHPWDHTQADAIFQKSEADPDGSEKRYATANGIAFVGQLSGDGTWHGYPEPWQKVPAELKENWLTVGRVSAAQLRQYKEFPRTNIRWALESDDD